MILKSTKVKTFMRNIKAFLLIFLFQLFLFSSFSLSASNISLAFNQLSNVASNVNSTHNIYLVLSSGISAGENITIDYTSTTFTFGSLYDYLDMQLEEGSTSDCNTATFTPKTLGGAPSGSTWGASYSSSIITFTSGTDTITANRCVKIILNSNGANHTITNPNVTSNTVYNINIETSLQETAQVAVIILGDSTYSNVDEINVEANIMPSILLGVDVVLNDCNNTTQTTPLNQKINFGNLFPGNLKRSGTEYPFICIESATNVASGLKIFVQSSRNNSIGGLVGTTSSLESNTQDLNLVSEGYGIRISSLGTTAIGSFTALAPFNSGTASSVGQIPGFLGSASAIIESTNVVRSNSNARIAIEVSVKASANTEKDNYSDTLSFTAFTNL